MHPKNLFAGILCYTFLNFSAAAQTSYVVYLDNYMLLSECVPYDIVKAAQTITLTGIDKDTTTIITIKYGSVSMSGAPGKGQIGVGGILNQTSRTFLQQSKGKTIIFEMIYSSKGINGIYSIALTVC